MNKHRIYVSSKVKHGPRWKLLRDQYNVPIISTWIDECEPGQTLDWADLWDRCITEASNCTALVLYAADETEVLKGALVEVGAALAYGKSVYYAGPLNQTVYRHPSVIHCRSIQDAFERAVGAE
jgi:hypothetical protein